MDPIEALQAALGPSQVLTGEAAAQAAAGRWQRLGAPIAVVRPSTTEEVASVVRIAAEAGVPVTAWGGKTGLVDGCNATGAIALSLERMRAVERIDTGGAVMVVQAGCPLQVATEAAEAAGLFLPLDLGARGSATIGGMISTNAGGNRVVRYGMTRDQVLGLEAVLADGQVISSMNPLIKNNAGYDLKQLFIGTEGTLGIVTRAVLRLRPHPTTQAAAILAVESFDHLAPLLRRLEGELAGGLSAFEVMWPDYYQLVTAPPAKGRKVLPDGHAFYVLIEALGANPHADQARLETVLEALLEDELISDAAIAKSGAERDEMWALRDDVTQTSRDGPIIAFDVGLPIDTMQAYVAEVRAALSARTPASRLIIFGHLGDGNLHLIASLHRKEDRHAIEETVYAPLRAIGGTVSAEHGIGLQKKAYLTHSRSTAEISLMRRVKAALDPKGILNPGKIVDG